ncbi:MAG: T9SS type A sorting domain-containing protein, partial [Bacteroidales bacterium]|nr:T9SS type A sorting domain-containing protein [Bacteroidales bacterium]
NVTSIGGDLWIESNATLTSLTGMENVTSIAGFLRIGNNATLTSLTGLDNVTSIGGYIHIYGNATLTSLTGLDNVTSIGGGLNISNNDTLTNLSGLDNVTSIGGALSIYYNDALTCLSGLENLTSIAGDLSIGHWYYGGNLSLTSLTGLNNLTSIGGALGIYYNPALTSLTGLDNIDATSIDSLFIIDNSFLSTCEVQSVCDYLAAPNGTIEIYNNAPGCNSQEEVEEACAVSVKSLSPEDEISIFPNPANRQLTISSKDGATIEEVIIYNQIGQIVHQEKPVNDIIDISQLHTGMYLIEVVSGQRKIREKLMIEKF